MALYWCVEIFREDTKSFLQDDQQLLSTLCKLDIHCSERDRHPASHLNCGTGLMYVDM